MVKLVLNKKQFPETVLSERITLKKQPVSLAQKIFDCIENDRQRLREFLPWVDTTVSIQDEISYLEMMDKNWTECTAFDYGIFNKSDGAYMGNIGLHTIRWEHQVAEIGYWILGSFEGQGYISEAVTALEKIAFDLGFHRIEIRCSSTNEQSAHVPLRCGYQLDGRLHENRVEHGKRADTLIFAKLDKKNL